MTSRVRRTGRQSHIELKRPCSRKESGQSERSSARKATTNSSRLTPILSSIPHPPRKCTLESFFHQRPSRISQLSFSGHLQFLGGLLTVSSGLGGASQLAASRQRLLTRPFHIIRSPYASA